MKKNITKHTDVGSGLHVTKRYADGHKKTTLTENKKK